MRSICPAGAVRRTMIRGDRSSVALEYPGAWVGAAGVGDHQGAVLGVQEGRSNLARPDDEVPQAIELLDHDLHLNSP